MKEPDTFYKKGNTQSLVLEETTFKKSPESANYWRATRRNEPFQGKDRAQLSLIRSHPLSIYTGNWIFYAAAFDGNRRVNPLISGRVKQIDTFGTSAE